MALSYLARFVGVVSMAALLLSCGGSEARARGEEVDDETLVEELSTSQWPVGITWNGKAAREEIRRVNPANMKHELLRVIPGVEWTRDSFSDPTKGIVYFTGSADAYQWNLYGVSAKTGKILSVAPFPTFESLPDGGYSGFNFGAGLHVMADGTTVGVTWHGEAQREEIHRVDPTTMQHTLIRAIPGVAWTRDPFSDPTRGIVYFIGSADAHLWNLYGVSAKTGEILSVAPFPTFKSLPDGGYSGFNFGAGLHVMADGTTVGVTWHGEAEREEIHRVDPTTMQHTLISAIPSVRWTSDSYTDRKRGVVYFRGSADLFSWRLYGVDVKTGAVLSAPSMPDFRYDADAGTYVGFNFGAGLHFVK